jgi:hypothetical protein
MSKMNLTKLTVFKYAPLDLTVALGKDAEKQWDNLMEHIAKCEKGDAESDFEPIKEWLDVEMFDSYLFTATKAGACNVTMVFRDMLLEIKYWRDKEAARIKRNQDNRVKRAAKKI